MTPSVRRHSLWPLFLLLLLHPPAAAFQKATEAAPPVPVQTNTPADAVLNPALPTVFIVGDSTARNGADLGWGDHFAALVDGSRLNVANRARAGRSSRTFYNEGLWDAVVAQLKPGDFVLLQMGHNDGGGSPDALRNDPKSRASLRGLGDETLDLAIRTPFPSGPLAGKTTETVHTYGWYLTRFIADTRAKGATPILLTLTIRNIWSPVPDSTAPGAPSTLRIERDMGFRDLELQLSANLHVHVADMANIAADQLDALGPEKTAALFPIDHTHTSAAGADLNAHAVAQALRNIRSPLAAYLK